MEREFSLNIKQTASLYGVSADALRYYESIGLIAPRRGANAYREYRKGDFGRLNIIMSMLNMNYTLGEIRSFLDNHSLETSFELFSNELDSIDAVMERLSQRRRKIEHCMQNISMSLRAREEQQAKVVHKGPRAYVIVSADELSGDIIPYATIKRMKELGMEIDSIHTVPCFILDPLCKSADGCLVAKKTLLSLGSGGDKGCEIFPEGNYLCRTTAGPAEITPAVWQEMNEFMTRNHLEAAGPLLEFWYVSEYISDNQDEYLHTLEIMVKPSEIE